MCRYLCEYLRIVLLSKISAIDIKFQMVMFRSEALPRNVHNGYFAVSSKSAAASQTLQTNPTNAEVLTAEDEAEVGRYVQCTLMNSLQPCTLLKLT